MKIPELYEIEYVFECDVARSDPEVPWYYDCISFSLARNRCRIDFSVEPGIGWGRVAIYVLDGKMIDLHLENIRELAIVRDGGYEGLVLIFDEGHDVQPLEIGTKPDIRVKWGTSLGLYR
ncbi:hypothetical protein IJ21_35540 [Paenibacillus sp. 32O-W]|uniref:hypothetical protein n=1 Tax=Paenibacillus sp. 32O-W TaxID=1695218 RepID=UPI0007209C8D|nr:hypothetical protein [Paenibacillus sp. 32O-W]ALS28942.1 hypothetical protein IJ21_35540 [Paenibacillus sp. 32O-W]